MQRLSTPGLAISTVKLLLQRSMCEGGGKERKVAR
jgi:hypothetical protein